MSGAVKRVMGHAWQAGNLVVSAVPPAATPLVIKCGGSLLGRPSWPDDLRSLLAMQAGGCLVVVGGGLLVDGLRRIDAAGPQPDELMHELAIACMGITARLVATALDLPRIAEPRALPGDVTAVLDPVPWFAACPRGRGLPATWRVTSDSIAATVAGVGGRLLLAKSVAPPAQALAAADPLAAVSAAGWVDAHFPTAAAGLAAISWAAPA